MIFEDLFATGIRDPAAFVDVGALRLQAAAAKDEREARVLRQRRNRTTAAAAAAAATAAAAAAAATTTVSAATPTPPSQVVAATSSLFLAHGGRRIPTSELLEPLLLCAEEYAAVPGLVDAREQVLLAVHGLLSSCGCAGAGPPLADALRGALHRRTGVDCDGKKWRPRKGSFAMDKGRGGGSGDFDDEEDGNEEEEEEEKESDESALVAAATAAAAAAVVTAPMTPATPAKRPVVSFGSWGGQCVAFAFRSMRLIVDDFLDVVPRRELAACVACVGAFGTQTSDMNVSLTAVGMLWSVVDFVSSSNAIATAFSSSSSSSSTANEAASLGVGAVGGGELGEKASVTARVWDTMFEELGRLSLDTRPEVRNCAVNTLVAAVVANGTFLSQRQWRACLEGVMLPLILEVEQTHEAALGGSSAHSAALASSNYYEVRLGCRCRRCTTARHGAQAVERDAGLDHPGPRPLAAHGHVAPIAADLVAVLPPSSSSGGPTRTSTAAAAAAAAGGRGGKKGDSSGSGGGGEGRGGGSRQCGSGHSLWRRRQC